MRVNVLSSGSKGNTTYIECGNTKILIDFGNTCKYVVDKLGDMGIKGNDIDAILITHTHVDHIKGLKVFFFYYKPVGYITRGMLEEIDYLDNYKILDYNGFTIGDINIDVIRTSHDAPESVGYIINGNSKTVVYVTDTGYINKKYFDKLINKDLYIFESNHDIEMLSNSRYPFRVRQRILGDKGHLSNYDSSRYLASFIGAKTKCVVLAHLSEENNTYELAYNTLKERLDMDGIEFDNIIIAKQDIETDVIEV